MVQIGSIASTANRRMLPTADLQIGGTSPAAAGGGIGAGLQELGAATGDVANAVTTFQLAQQREQERLAEFDRQTSFVSFGSDQATKLGEASRELSGPAQDFTKGFMSGFDADASKFLEGVPTAHKKEWTARLQQLRSGVAADALKTEFGQRDAYYKTTIADSLGKLANGAMSSPDKLENWQRQGDEIITTSGMSEQDKAEQLLRWHGTVAISAAQGDIQRDPEGALTRLGGLRLETKTEAQGKADAPGAPVSVGKAKDGNPGNIVDGAFARSQPGYVGPGRTTASGYTFARFATPEAGAAAQENLLKQHYLAKGFDTPREIIGKYAPPNAKGNSQASFKNYLAYIQRHAGIGPDDKVDASNLPQFARAQREFETGQGSGASTAANAPAAAVMGYPIVDSPDKAAWAKRADGSDKGTGWLGVLKRPDGGVSSEVSVGVEINGKETEIPLMVPGLNKSELDYIMTHKPDDPAFQKNMPASIMQKAVAHAQAQLAAGSSPFNQGPAPSAEAPSVDPRYAALPADARMQLIGAAQRQIQQREVVQAVADQKQHADWLNGFYNELNDGKAGTADIDAARKAGVLKDYDEINRAQSIVAERAKADLDINTYNTLIATPGFAWNRYDERQIKAVDAGVKAAGGTPDAAFTIWQKTGILGKAGAVALRGALVSTSAQQVREGANVAGNMLRQNPNAFAGVEGGSDMEHAGLAWNHYTYELGMKPEQAAQRIAEENSPAFKEKVKLQEPAMQAYRKQLRDTGADDPIKSGVFGSYTFTAPAKYLDDAARMRAQQRYSDLIIDELGRGRDLSTAKAVAGKQLQKIYGITRNGYLEAYPPEKGYQPVNGSHDYVYADAINDVMTALKRTDAPTAVHIVPIPGVTDQGFRTGAPPRYRLLYSYDHDGQHIFNVLPGEFVADTAKALADLSAQRERDTTTRAFATQPDNIYGAINPYTGKPVTPAEAEAMRGR